MSLKQIVEGVSILVGGCNVKEGDLSSDVDGLIVLANGDVVFPSLQAAREADYIPEDPDGNEVEPQYMPVRVTVEFGDEPIKLPELVLKKVESAPVVPPVPGVVPDAPAPVSTVPLPTPRPLVLKKVL